MNCYATENIRNIMITGHGGTGKTSLIEAMLFNSGLISRMGRIEDGNTISDYHPEEVLRHSTVHTSLIPIENGKIKLNLLDTPGFSDFIGEVKAALRVVESGMLVLSAVSGIEVQHEIIWQLLEKFQLPRIIFINKMDRENANSQKVLDGLNKTFKGNFLPINLPLGEGLNFKGIVDVLHQKAYEYTKNGKRNEISLPNDYPTELKSIYEKILEAAVEEEDALTLKYLEGEKLSPAEILFGLRKTFSAAKVVPVLFGSSINDIGIRELLDFLTEYAPAPAQNDGETSALVFKTLADPYVGRMNFVRLFSGKLQADSSILNLNKRKVEKIGQIIYLRGKQSLPTSEVPCGDIAVLVKLADTVSSETLGSNDTIEPQALIDFPIPNYSIAIVPKTKNDEDKLGDAIQKLTEEDPSLKFIKNKETKQTLMTGMGEAHLNITMDKLKRRYGVNVFIEEIKVPYRETIKAKIEAHGKHKKQSGGRGQYGDVFIRFEPLSSGDFEFSEEIFGGSVPRNYFPAVEKGLKEVMNEGVLAGYPTVGLKATLYDGSYHSVDSSEMAFKIAASMAFKKGIPLAKPVLLEPVMQVTVLTPDEFMGDIISDFNTKRGKVQGTDQTEEGTMINALVPQSEMFKYTNDLKSITQGRGTFTMEFYNYEEVPGNICEKIIAKEKELK